MVFRKYFFKRRNIEMLIFSLSFRIDESSPALSLTRSLTRSKALFDVRFMSSKLVATLKILKSRTPGQKTIIFVFHIRLLLDVLTYFSPILDSFHLYDSVDIEDTRWRQNRVDQMYIFCAVSEKDSTVLIYFLIFIISRHGRYDYDGKRRGVEEYRRG